MKNRSIIFGILLMMTFLMSSLAFATTTINDIDFPDKIGTAYRGKSLLNISSDSENDLLIKTQYYVNGSIAQENSYIDGSRKFDVSFNYDDTSLAFTTLFKDYFLSSGKDDTSPGTNNPKVWDREGNMVYNFTDLAGLVCYTSTYDESEDTLWIGCTNSAKALWKINATSYEIIEMYNSSNSGLFINGVNNDVRIYGDYLFAGQSNAGRLLNKTTLATIKSFTTNCGQRGWFDEDLDMLYVVCGGASASLIEYNLTSAATTNYYNGTADPFLGAQVIPYSFSNDDRLLVINYDTVLGDQSIGVYNKSNMSQGLIERKTYPLQLGNYQYQYRVNDPNMFWSTLAISDTSLSYAARGIDRDLDMVLFPTGGGTRPPIFFDPDKNEWWVQGTTSGPFLVGNLYNKATKDDTIFSKMYTSGGLLSGYNLTLKVSIFDSVTGEVSRLNETALVYNNNLSLTFPKTKAVIQRGLDNKSQLNIYGTYSGDSIDSFNMTYEGTDSGVLNIPITAGEFNTSINLTAGDYILKYMYDDIELANNYEFGVGDVIVIHGQSNSVNTDNGGKAVNKSSHGVYKTTKTGYQTTACYALSYSSSDMEPGNRWAELAHTASIEEDVPVIVHNFAVGGRDLDYINSSCWTYDMQTLNAETGNNIKIKGLYYYGSESDGSDTYEQYYPVLVGYINRWFDNVDFPIGNLFSIGQTLGTPLTTDNSGVRLGIQNAWYSIEGTERGSIMYDIKTNPEDSVHPYGDGKYVFTERNNKAALHALFNLYSPAPVLGEGYIYNSSRLILGFSSSNLEISNWEGISDTVFSGLVINGSSITSSNISEINISNDYVIVDLNSEILSDGQEISLCKDPVSCYNESVLRDSTNNVPVEIVWGFNIEENTEFNCNWDEKVWYEGACYLDLLTACSSNGLVILDDTCVTADYKECKSISAVVYDSFSLGVVAILVLIAGLIIGILMVAFGGASNLDAASIGATITIVVLSALMFIIGVIVYGKVSGAIC